MSCSTCGNQAGESERFCRKCGTELNKALAPVKQGFLKKESVCSRIARASSKDPDELTGNGIGSVIVGDGFFMVAVFLSTAHTSIGSLLWLLLLIPAFFFFGRGFADVLHARQIRLRLKQRELDSSPITAELPPPLASAIDVFNNYSSGKLLTAPSVTERTTRELRT
jgi:hypothetical protein